MSSRGRTPESRAWRLVDLTARIWHAWQDRHDPGVRVVRADCRHPDCDVMFDSENATLARSLLDLHVQREHVEVLR